jgi:hypothetical protein
MKKALCIITCVITSIAAARAQTITPKFGISLSTISASKSTNPDINSGVKNKIGISGGLAVEFVLKKRISIQPELLYVQKGNKYFLRANTGISTDYIITLNYLEVPVLIKAKFDHFYFNVGPSLAMGLDGNYKITTNHPAIPHHMNGKIKFGKSSDENPDNDVYIDRRFDIGLQIGGGYVLANLIMIDLRYGFGMTNIYGNDSKSKLRSFQATLGVPIRLGKSKRDVQSK